MEKLRIFVKIWDFTHTELLEEFFTLDTIAPFTLKVEKAS